MTSEVRRSGSCTGEYPEIRQQLIALIRKGGRSRTAVFTHRRPTNIRFGEVDHPDSGSPLTHVDAVWPLVVRLLEANNPLTRIALRRPPGEKAWVCKGRLSSDGSLIYVKLQIRGSKVLLRSFHHTEYAHD